MLAFYKLPQFQWANLKYVTAFVPTRTTWIIIPLGEYTSASRLPYNVFLLFLNILAITRTTPGVYMEYLLAVIHIMIHLQHLKQPQSPVWPKPVWPTGSSNRHRPPPSVRVSTCWRSLRVLGLAPHPLEPGPKRRNVLSLHGNATAKLSNSKGYYIGWIAAWMLWFVTCPNQKGNGKPLIKHVYRIHDISFNGWYSLLYFVQTPMDMKKS